MMRRLLLAVHGADVLVLLAFAAWLVLEHDWHPLAALLVVLAAPFAFVALFLVEQFAIGAWQRRSAGVSPRFGWTQSLRAWAGEFPVTIRTFFYAQIRHADHALPSAAVATRIPVLFVHGYVCNRGIWWSFASRLAARGHAVESVNLEPVFGSIDDYAAIVAAGVERLRAATGAARVAIVAHSMGGLAARTFLARDGHEAVACLVTLGSPHHGTWLAHFGHGRNVRQMLPESAWLRELAERETPAARARITAVFTHHDNVVMPQATQTLEGASVIEFSGLGHVQLVYDARVQERVVQVLDGCDPHGLAGPEQAAVGASAPAEGADLRVRNAHPASTAGARAGRP